MLLASHKAGFFFGDQEKTGVSSSAGTQVSNKGRIRPSEFCSSEQEGEMVVPKVRGAPNPAHGPGL